MNLKLTESVTGLALAAFIIKSVAVDYSSTAWYIRTYIRIVWEEAVPSQF